MYFIAGQPRESGTLDGQGANARFESPAAVAVTIDGTFYVTDRAANVVRKLKYNGEEFDFDVETFAREDLLEPAGIAVDDSGRVYVADRGNHVIRTIAENGVISTYAGTTGVAGYRDGDVTTALFNRPNGIAIDAFGNIYVSEEANGDIRKIAPNGRVTTVANGLRRPGLFTIAEDGTFWIPDTGNGRLLRGTSSLPERRRGVRH